MRSGNGHDFQGPPVISDAVAPAEAVPFGQSKFVVLPRLVLEQLVMKLKMLRGRRGHRFASAPSLPDLPAAGKANPRYNGTTCLRTGPAMPTPHNLPPTSRREFLLRSGGG